MGKYDKELVILTFLFCHQEMLKEWKKDEDSTKDKLDKMEGMSFKSQVNITVTI